MLSEDLTLSFVKFLVSFVYKGNDTQAEAQIFNLGGVCNNKMSFQLLSKLHVKILGRVKWYNCKAK